MNRNFHDFEVAAVGGDGVEFVDSRVACVVVPTTMEEETITAGPTARRH